MGGPLRAGSLRVEVAVRERKVYVGAAQADSLEELPQELAPDALVELPNGRRWLRKLDKLAIAQRWRSRFTASAPLSADTRWQLLYKEQGKNARHITGLGAFPENWTSFVDCLNELPDVSIQQQNHLEYIRFLLVEKVPVITGRKRTVVELREKLVLDRRKRMILYNRHKEDFGTERHAYDLPKAVSNLLDALDKPAAFEQRLHVRCIDGSDTAAHRALAAPRPPRGGAHLPLRCTGHAGGLAALPAHAARGHGRHPRPLLCSRSLPVRERGAGERTAMRQSARCSREIDRHWIPAILKVLINTAYLQEYDR